MKRVLATFAAIAFSYATPAQAHQIPVNTIGGLVENCTIKSSDQTEIEYHIGLCIGFIKGVTNAMMAEGKLMACLPRTLDNLDLIEAFLSRARRLDSRFNDQPSVHLVMLAIGSAFPCR